MSTTTRTLSPEDVRSLFRMHHVDSLGGRIMALRRFYALSYRELSRRTGISTSVLYAIENGGHTFGPRYDTVERVADAFGVTAHELLERSA